MSHALFKARTLNRATRPIGGYMLLFFLGFALLVTLPIAGFVIWALLR